jgi:hypothetical protein
VEPSPNGRAGSRGVRLTDRDRELLELVAEHRLVLGAHVQALLGASAAAAATRLRALTRAGFVTSLRPFHGQPACYQIRPGGLAAIDSERSVPRIDLRCYTHDVGAAWLWLAARDGRFGPLRDVLGERRLRSLDASPDRSEAPYGVRLGGMGARGRERLHYPDLLLITPEGRRIGLELELSSKGRVRREKILAGYGADARYDAVLYLVRDRRIGRSIQQSARKLGIGALVHVQQVSLPAAVGGSAAGRAVARASGAHRAGSRDRAPGAEAAR